MPVVRANGIRLHYEERGTGEPLILIMGLGADGSLWDEHVCAYESRYRCILLDNRGAGRSDKPPGPYSTVMMATDTLRLMDALGIERAHVSGISMGGCIAQELALLAPSRVRSLTLISSWPGCDAYTVRIFNSLRALVATCDAVTFVRMLQLWIFSPEYHAAHMDDLLRREAMAVANPFPMPAYAFQAQCDACIAHDTLGRLQHIAVPTLITVGGKDIFTPLHYAQAIHERIVGSELFVLDDCAHAHHWESLEAFNARTLAFMQRCSSLGRRS